AAAVIAKLGIAWCFGLNALSYFTVLLGLALIKLPPWRPPPITSSPWRGMLEGIRYIRSHATVRALVQMVTVYAVLGIPYLTLMRVFAREILRTGAAGFGLLLTCVGIGGLAGALTLAAVGGHVRRGRLLTISSYSFGALLIALSLVRAPSLAYPILLLAGFA